MARLVFGVLAAAWAFAGWRNMPRLDHAHAQAAAAAIVASLWAAYKLGARRVRESAVAVAVAKAEAAAMAAVAVTADNRSSAQVVVNLDPGLGVARAAAVQGLEQAPWMVGATRRPELEETDFLDVLGQELSEPEVSE